MTSPTDLALIDAFEKIHAYLLERDPALEGGLLGRGCDRRHWKELEASEYQEIFVAVVLGIDRGTPAGRRAVRNRLRQVRDHSRVASDGASGKVKAPARRGELFRPEGRERWFRDNVGTIADGLRLFDETEASPPPLIAAVAQCETRREAVSTVQKRSRLLRGLRGYDFLEQIGYPIVVPDPARQRLFHRLGWIETVTPATRFPQQFFEICERLVHLTGEPWNIVSAATGLFAGSRDKRAGSAERLAVCTARPRCGDCVLSGQCAYFRYRGEPKPTRSRSVKRMAYSEQPRTRFEALGPSSLSEAELLSLLIRTGTGGKSSLDLAREVLERFGSLEGLAEAGVGELRQIKGIGRAKAIEIKAAVELGRRLRLGMPITVGEVVRRSEDVFAIYRGLLENERQENFYLVILNTRNRIEKHFLISRGSLTGSPVHPREVMKAAIRESAASVIFVHNHPSGDPDPSEDDIEITGRLLHAARLVGIRVLDHVIIGRDQYFSFADHGMLGPGG